MIRALFILLAGLAISPADELTGRVMCGYQGWFRCPDDGAGRGWHHYAVNGKFEPGHSHIEMWPDMSEYGPDERHATPFRHADGSVAEVFSSTHPETVRRHFRWMREYGIDGVFLQRFASETLHQGSRAAQDRVLANCRAAAAAEQRKWVLMYDLSGLAAADFPKLIGDWKRLHKDGPMREPDPACLRFRGKPLVALWGIGFNDRPAALTEWESLIRFFREAGHAVMLGVPCHWRTLDRDAINDPGLHRIIAMADIISPWAVGRFGAPEQAAARADSLLKPDLAWCGERGIRYLPVAFPGFSWHNLQKSRGRDEKPDAIPRLGGRFLWSQAEAVRKAGLDSIYIAMFDEMDEATAIFKTTRNPPVGASPFLSEPGIAPDHYLRVAGAIGQLLRGEQPGWRP